MKSALTIITVIVMSGGAAFAQGSSPYRVDNFDFAGAVTIELPKPPTLKRSSRSRKSAASGSPTNASNGPLAQLTGMNISGSLGAFSTGDANVDSFIVESGRRNAVDPLLLYAIMHQESSFQRGAISPKGARGLMQLMPGTAVRFGVTNIFDPRQNIEGGARYMRFLLDQFEGNIQLALAGYNAGEGAVMKYGNNIPPYAETQEYVRRIARRYALIRDPLAAKNANQLTADQLATVQKQSAPLTIYERTVFAVRLPDGSLQLVSQ